MGKTKFFNPQNSVAKSKDSLLSQLESSLRADSHSSEQALDIGPWREMLAEHRVAKLKEEAKKSLNKDGLPFDEKALKEILWEFFISQNSKLKRNAERPFSVILDKKRTPYAIFRGVLGKGAIGKVKLVQNLLTKEFAVVKVCTENTETEASFLKRRNLLRGKQERENKKGGKKSYLFIDLLPGITVTEFCSLLTQNKEILTDKQQALFLSALLKALVKLLEADIHHQDLHSGNVLIDPLNWRANIIDFGLAKDISQEKNKDFFHHGTLQNILAMIANKITDPQLKEEIERLKATMTEVLPSIKKALKRIKTQFLFDEKISSEILFKLAMEKGSIDIFGMLFNSAMEKESIDIFQHGFKHFDRELLKDSLLNLILKQKNPEILPFYFDAIKPKWESKKYFGKYLEIDNHSVLNMFPLNNNYDVSKFLCKKQQKINYNALLEPKGLKSR